MNMLKRAVLLISIILATTLLSVVNISAQKSNMMISAVAMGTSTQMGRVINIDLRVFELSKPSDQQVLLEAFTSEGSQGLASALDKMSSKGRMAITGTLGYDVNYIRHFKNADGSETLRFVTDRAIRFGEAWASTRSMDYNISIVEIIKKTVGGKVKYTGTLLPAVWPKLKKNGELEIEAYQNPWNLTNIRIHKG